MRMESLGVFNPLCGSTLVMMNRETVPSPAGLSCKPCFGPALDSGEQCCRTCFTIDFPGVTSPGDVDTAGAQTINLVYWEAYDQRTTGDGCRWGNGKFYNGDYTQYSPGVRRLVAGGTWYWDFTFLSCGMTISGHRQPKTYAQLYLQFGCTINHTYTPDCYGFTAPSPTYHSLVQCGFECSTFDCSGGVFTQFAISAPLCEGNCCSAVWPDSLTVTGCPCVDQGQF